MRGCMVRTAPAIYVIPVLTCRGVWFKAVHSHLAQPHLRSSERKMLSLIASDRYGIANKLGNSAAGGRVMTGIATYAHS